MISGFQVGAFQLNYQQQAPVVITTVSQPQGGILGAYYRERLIVRITFNKVLFVQPTPSLSLESGVLVEASMRVTLPALQPRMSILYDDGRAAKSKKMAEEQAIAEIISIVEFLEKDK